jgi:hypothetical protein
MMQGVLPNLKIASREMTLRGWDDDLPTPIMIRGWTERTDFWLRAWWVMKSNSDGNGCLSSSLSTYSLHETETEARQRKQVCQHSGWRTVDRDRCNEPVYLILPAPPPVPMFPARHRPIIEAFCFSRRLPRCRAASVSIQTENYTDNGYDPWLYTVSR